MCHIMALRLIFDASVNNSRDTRYPSERNTKAIRDHPLGKKCHKGIFIGYDLRPGGIWSGDYYIVDAAALANADAVHNVHCLRVKDVIVPDYFVFPVATGALTQPEDQRAPN